MPKTVTLLLTSDAKEKIMVIANNANRDKSISQVGFQFYDVFEREPTNKELHIFSKMLDIVSLRGEEAFNEGMDKPEFIAYDADGVFEE